MIINIPIEPIPSRYSVDWYNWFNTFFNKKEILFRNICGSELTKGIESGQFLDCIGTNYYKSSQLMQILEQIYKKEIKSGDVLFFHDLWFPGIEQIKYVCDTMKIQLKITGCLHAGAYDPNDFLYQSNTGNWAIHFEHMLFSLVDKIFVATHYHKDLILKSRSVNPDKIKITGFPFISRKTTFRPKENIIVFPHRMAKEKNPDVFNSIKNHLSGTIPNWEFITTADKKISKEGYYNILESSKICISLADQETWGISMQEATVAKCIPLVPNKLSYRSMYFPIFRYNDIFDLLHKIISITSDYYKFYSNYMDTLLDQIRYFESGGSEAFENILKELITESRYYGFIC